jgi:hypothetical protein
MSRRHIIGMINMQWMQKPPIIGVAVVVAVANAALAVPAASANEHHHA